MTPYLCLLGFSSLPRINPPFIVSSRSCILPSSSSVFPGIYVISDVPPSIPPGGQRGDSEDPAAPNGCPRTAIFYFERSLCRRQRKKNFSPGFISQRLISKPSPSKKPAVLQLPGRSALLPGEAEPRRTAEAGAWTRGCARLSASARPHFAPSTVLQRRTPFHPVFPTPDLAKPGLPSQTGRLGSWRDGKPAAAVPPPPPPSPALRCGCRAHGTPQRVAAAAAEAAAAAAAAAGRVAVAGVGAAAAGAHAPSHSPLLLCPVLSTALPGRTGVQGTGAKAKKAGLTSGAHSARQGSGSRPLHSSLALPGAPRSAAGAAHELPT